MNRDGGLHLQVFTRRNEMKKFALLGMAIALFLASFSFGASASAKTPKVLEFDTMAGVPRPYTGPVNAIRGIPGGGLPWVVSFASGELSASGKLEITVMGLVIDPNDAAAIAAGRGGTNPSPNFKAIVSCLSKDAAGAPITVNISTGLFPADAAGNSQIEAQVSLPQPCIAPIIFVASPAGSWFAATGQ
jgi:hypothetical protein